ncbi:MAG: TIGR01777 family oxidoreductase [Sphingobacteriales bacterium]|jgi:uncharacterized protein (TIGR01777 family)
MATVMITGGTGLIGSALSKLLINNGYDVIILSRNPLKTAKENDYEGRIGAFKSAGQVYYSRWDIDKQYIDPAALAKTDHIIHLAGAGVADKRWSASRKKEILDSRTKSSALLVKALRELPHKVKDIVSASAIGWYGPDRGRPFIETDPSYPGFLGDTCKQWEESISPVEELGIRLVKLRMGIVLSDKGGALKEFRKPMHFGVAAIMGSGDQVISWIHIEDLCRLFLYSMEESSMKGVYNAVAPNPVTNRDLTKLLSDHVTDGRAISLHIPSFILKIMLGEMSIEVLKSATVSSEKVQQVGFEFLYPTLSRAIIDLY